MKNSVKTVLMAILLSSASFASEYVVVSNKNMRNLSPSQIKAIFLKKLTVLDDLKVIPVNLGARDSLRLEFEKEVLHMSFTRLKKYWIQQHYLGHRPPISMKSDKSVKAFVKKVDGSIGYIHASNVDSSLKIIYRWSE